MSSPNHKRGPEGTVQRRVFLAIAAGARRCPAIAEAAGLPPSSVSKACHYLKLAGLVIRCQGLKWAEWEIVPGAKPPKDKRGKRKASRNHRGPRAYASWVTMMRGKHGRAWCPPLPIDSSPLAQCWRRPPPACQEARA